MVRELKHTEIGDIPVDWELQTFDETFRVISNNTLSRENLNNRGGAVRNIHYGDILTKFPEVLDCSEDEIPFVNDLSLLSSSTQLLQDGDVVIADTAEDETVGKVTEVQNLGDSKLVAGLHTIPCRVKKGDFAPGWLGYYMNSDLFHNQILPYITGIYYMLSYAFQILNEQGYKNIATEQFNNTAELMAAILEKGIAIQLKRGLGKEYIPQTEALSSLRGKIDIAESIKTQSMLRKQLICTYDEFSVNSIMNRIIKSTVELLLRSNILKQRKKNLRKLMLYFSEVDFIDLYTVNWNVQYNRNNQTYRMLISICYLVVKGLLQTQSDGSTKLMDFLDEQRMCRLYEKFILEYYRREFKNQITANASQIPWQLDNDENSMLPVMQSDIMLQRDDNVLIIDAKYYEHSMQVQFNKHTLHSANLYQIFTYVKNKEYELKEKDHTVSGMLLYTKTDEEIYPNNVYQMSGNQIMVRALDLNLPFTEIAKQLNTIAKVHFNL